MKEPIKYLLKDNQSVDYILDELQITQSIVYKLEDKDKILRFIKMLKANYKKRTKKTTNIIEPRDYVYINNNSIGWTDEYKLIDQKLDIIDETRAINLQYYINIDFISEIKLDKSTKFVGILVTDTYVVVISNTYCIICEKEDEPMELPIDNLLQSSKAFNEVYNLKITNDTTNSFECLKTLCEGFKIKAKREVIDLFRIKYTPNSLYFTLCKEALNTYTLEQSRKEDRKVDISNFVFRVAFGTDKIVDIDNCKPLLVSHFDISNLAWVIPLIEYEKVQLKIADYSESSPLVFDLDDLMILIIPARIHQ